MSMAKVLAKGQIVIPKDIREKANLHTGDKVDVQMTPKGIVVVPIRKTYTEKVRGSIKGKLSLQELEDLYAEKS
ncbi:MAG: Antidote-toxin recognition MazE, bacterial antitoxin [Nitrospirae bacterium]|jgi:AbrB family looped-hinge helix DNA binding protein|nr:Antidote-toxin recognition MazE, bacterial antitoxin [Nitrospirota bacterium]